LLSSKARREWLIACQLQKGDLNIPEPFGWMERRYLGFVKESYYLSEAIGSGVSLAEEPGELKDERFVAELAATVKRIHHSGLLHKDFHAGNFMRDGESLFLTDLHQASILRALSLNQRLWNLSHLFHSLRSRWGEKEQMQFIEKYFEEEPPDLEKKEELLQRIHLWMDRLRKRQWRSRTKRCLKESTEFSIKKERGIYYYRRREFPLDQLKGVLEKHRHSISENPSALAKLSSEVVVSLLDDGRKRVCVKQFLYPQFRDRLKGYIRRSKGLKAWIAGNGLRTRGIPSLVPLALMERKGFLGLRESYFFMETLEKGQELDRYILRGFEDLKKRRLFIKAFAQWLSHCHEKGLYHKDMKTCNILVSDKGEDWDFNLLDLEDVLLDEKVDERKLFKNLLQLNTSVPRLTTRTDRLRFVKNYLSSRPIIKDLKPFLNRLMEETRKRGIVYVSPEGVVIEKMG